MLFYVYIALGILCGLCALLFCPMAPTAAGWYIAPFTALLGWLALVIVHLLTLVITALTLKKETPFYFGEERAFLKKIRRVYLLPASVFYNACR